MRQAGSVDGLARQTRPAHFHGLFHIKFQLLLHGSELAW